KQRIPPRATLVPYTTLFRSTGVDQEAGDRAAGERGIDMRIGHRWGDDHAGRGLTVNGHGRIQDNGFLVQAVVDLDRAARCHGVRSEEHTSELQSRSDLVCRL